jgi:hypothetical protein
MKILALIVSALFAMCATTAFSAEEGPVWFWFEACGGPFMKLQVRFDDKVVYESTFPICHAPRSSIHARGGDKKLNFSFNPQRSITWLGYKDESEKTSPKQSLVGDLWLAGADPDALLIGVSFSSARSIYMNTIHIAQPGKQDQTQIAPGLVVVSMPVARGK